MNGFDQQPELPAFETVILTGLRQDIPATVRKHPVAVSHHICLMQVAGILGTGDRRRFKVMAAVALIGFLCPSELYMTDAEHYLKVKDVRFSDFNLLHCRLKLRSSKHPRTASNSCPL